MKLHTWMTETVDSGSMGVNRFWLCTGCGACGGPRAFDSETKPKWRAFLAGEGSSVALSIDCDETAKIIRDITLKRLAGLAKERRDISPHYANLVMDALRWTPEKKNVTVAYKVYGDVKHWVPRPSLAEVRQRLVAAGFNVTPPVAV